MSKYFITTSIPYVNGDPHIGHAYELIVSDVFARYAVAQGKEVIFSTGTDEHGAKIAEKAKAQGIKPIDLVDKISAQFQELTDRLNISNNRFIRTTDPAHEDRAQLIWKKLEKDIYKDNYEGWYCTGDEAFFSETEVKENNGVCPNHNRPYEKVQEENYFFKLSKYSKRIGEAIRSEKFNVLPVTKRNEILSLIDGGLEDISISRPITSTDWGIPVPGDKKQVMYVWLEALLNYITVLGYPEHSDFKEYWPAKLQVIGKDIIRFHAAIWPAILMSLGLELPEKLYVHGFINIDGQKMGKSLGNFVDPLEIVDRYSTDALRYFLIRKIPSNSDGDFSWQAFEDSYNNELANELGNAVQRTLAMINNYQDGIIGEVPPPPHDIAAYQEAIKDCRLDKALDAVWLQIRGLNQYIEETKPWEIVKTGDHEHLNEVLSYQVSSILEISELLAPFLPATSAKIKEIFGSDKVKTPKETLFPKKEYNQED